MAHEEYERGFAAAFEYARLLVTRCYEPLDDHAWRLRDHLDQQLSDACLDAQWDPADLRRRIMEMPRVERPAPPTPAEVVDLAAVRQQQGQERVQRFRPADAQPGQLVLSAFPRRSA